MSALCPSGQNKGYGARDDARPHAAQDTETILSDSLILAGYFVVLVKALDIAKVVFPHPQPAL